MFISLISAYILPQKQLILTLIRYKLKSPGEGLFSECSDSEKIGVEENASLYLFPVQYLEWWSPSNGVQSPPRPFEVHIFPFSAAAGELNLVTSSK